MDDRYNSFVPNGVYNVVAKMKKLFFIIALIAAATMPAAAYEIKPIAGFVAPVVTPTGRVICDSGDPIETSYALYYEGVGGYVAGVEGSKSPEIPQCGGASGTGFDEIADTYGAPVAGSGYLVTIAGGNNDCEGLTLSECRDHANYLYENIFTVASGGTVGLPTDIAARTAANVSGQLSDGGTLTWILTAAGVYLVFWVMRRIINLVPRDRNRESDR